MNGLRVLWCTLLHALATRVVFLLAALCALPVWAAPLTIRVSDLPEDAAAPLVTLVSKHLSPELPAKASPEAVSALRLRLEDELPPLLATEGYFSATFQLLPVLAGDPAVLTLRAGPRTRISVVTLNVSGLPETPEGEARLTALRQSWHLPAGQPFRQADWDSAKTDLLRQLLSDGYPAAAQEGSYADIDPATASAQLFLHYRSGPLYRFGPLQYLGLERYSPELLARHNTTVIPGEVYRSDRLLALQSTLQNLPYFSSVLVQVPLDENNDGNDSEETDPAHPREKTVPVQIRVRERSPHRAAFGVGISSNTGARVEASLRSNDFLHQAWQLESAVRLEQLKQSAFADIYLPLHSLNVRDSVGVVGERSEIEGLSINRVGLGVMRTQQRGPVEMRLGTNWQTEWHQADGLTSKTQKALAFTAGWRWRQAGSWFGQRNTVLSGYDAGDEGMAAQFQIGGGSKSLWSDQDFLRLYGRYQQSLALGRRDTLMFRWEGGSVLAHSRDGIPQDFLFRAGGSNSVRGYAYQSLGVREGRAIVGGRYLTTMSAEFTHWFLPPAETIQPMTNGKPRQSIWGMAVFADAGQAGDNWSAMMLQKSWGIGARWRTVAGPLAVDLAWGEADKTPHLHFSLAIPF